MPLESVQVFYVGWGERWLWGTLASTASLSGRPQILFEYSDEARRRGLELSALRLPLQGPKLRRDFPAHQLGLPGPVYDALPDGWGMLLMVGGSAQGDHPRPWCIVILKAICLR